MKHAIRKSQLHSRFVQMFCLALNRWTRSWPVRLWRMVWVVFMLLGALGSVWHVYHGIFNPEKGSLASIARQNIPVLRPESPDFLAVPIDSILRSQQTPIQLEP